MQPGEPVRRGERPPPCNIPLPAVVKSYLEVRCFSSESEREFILPIMIKNGVRNFEETDEALIGYVDQTGWDKAGLGRFKEELELDLRPLSLHAPLQYRDLADQNW